MEGSAARKRPGIKGIEIALEPDMKFEAIVDLLSKALVVPDIGDIRGCNPCLSGLDRLVLESTLERQIR